METGRNNEGEMMQSAERQTKLEIREEKKRIPKKREEGRVRTGDG